MAQGWDEGSISISTMHIDIRVVTGSVATFWEGGSFWKGGHAGFG